MGKDKFKDSYQWIYNKSIQGLQKIPNKYLRHVVEGVETRQRR